MAQIIYFNFITYSLSGFGQGWQTPSLAIMLLGQGMQNLRFELGTKPSGHFLHEPSNDTISSAWHCEQEVLSPFGNDPSGQVSH